MGGVCDISHIIHVTVPVPSKVDLVHTQRHHVIKVLQFVTIDKIE
jgi:hypothetical protein